MSDELVAEITDYLSYYPCEREAIMECPLAESLWRIVRRILRTQSKRTGFEIRVLNEARRLANGPLRGCSRDALAEFVVDHLLASSSASHTNIMLNEPMQTPSVMQALSSTAAVVR
jgi:hypothetical protein